MSEKIVEELRQRVAQLEAELARASASQARGKIAEMSSEVVDSNPYRSGFRPG